MRGVPLLALAGGLAACAGPRPAAPAPLTRAEIRAAYAQPAGQPGAQDEDFFRALERSRRHWEPGQVLLQGYVGVGYPQGVTFDSADGSPIEIDGDELDNLPVVGGGGQLKLAGEAFDFGLEGMLGISFRSDLEAFAAGGSGAVVVLDLDLFVLDFFGGPFLSKRLGDRVRLYAAAGPLIQFLEYSEDGDDGSTDGDGSGYGGGLYGRGGIEFLLPSGSLVGFGVRYSSTDVNLGGELGDYDLESLQLLITVSRSGGTF